MTLSDTVGRWKNLIQLCGEVVFAVSINILMFPFSSTMDTFCKIRNGSVYVQNVHTTYVLIGKNRDCVNVYQ